MVRGRARFGIFRPDLEGQRRFNPHRPITRSRPGLGLHDTRFSSAGGGQTLGFIPRSEQDLVSLKDASLGTMWHYGEWKQIHGTWSGGGPEANMLTKQRGMMGKRPQRDETSKHVTKYVYMHLQEVHISQGTSLKVIQQFLSPFSPFPTKNGIILFIRWYCVWGVLNLLRWLYHQWHVFTPTVCVILKIQPPYVSCTFYYVTQYGRSQHRLRGGCEVDGA